MPKPATKRPEAVAKAVAAFEAHGGVLRMADALCAGIHRNTLYAMLEQGVVERLCRGLYRLSAAGPLGSPDLVTVAKKVPDGVICLISALAYHELTTQIPHEIHVAVLTRQRAAATRLSTDSCLSVQRKGRIPRASKGP